MPGNNHPLDTTHYETYETQEFGHFVDPDGEVWTSKETYADGAVSYGRSHAPQRAEPKRGLSCLPVLGILFLLFLLAVIVLQFIVPL